MSPERTPQGAGATPDKRSGIGRRGWLIALLVAAIGAALTDLLTGGITSGAKSAWHAVVGEKPAPPPLTVSARVIHDRRSSFVFEKPLADLPAPPRDVSSDAARVRWAERNGGIDGFYSTIEVVIQGRKTAAVVLQELTIDVVSRKDPPTGTLIGPAGAGGIGVRYFAVDLDRESPEAELGQANEPQPGERQINFPYKVSLTDPEVFMILGDTQRYDCKWTAKLRWRSGDRAGTTTIRDGDEPFRTASGTEAQDKLAPDQNRRLSPAP